MRANAGPRRHSTIRAKCVSSTTPLRGFFHARLTKAYRFLGRGGAFSPSSPAIASSGPGALGSSATATPPGFRIRPKVHLPDQGRRKRRAKERTILKPLPPTDRSPTVPSRHADAVQVRLHDEPRRGLDLAHRPNVEPGAEPAPSLGPRRPTREARPATALAGTRQDEHLDPLPEGPDLREDAVPVAAPPGDPVAAHVPVDPVLMPGGGDPQALPQRLDDLPRRVTRPIDGRLHTSPSPIPNRFPHDQEELEAPEEEVESPRAVLPHWRCRPVVMPDEGNRIEDLELPL